VVIAEFAGFCGEAEVCDGRDFEVGDLEACGPFVDGFVLEFEFEVLVGEVGEFGNGGDLGVADASGLVHVILAWICGLLVDLGLVAMSTYRASSNLVRLAVIVLIVDSLSITVHGHDVWEHSARSVVLVCVEEDTKTLEIVCVAEDIARLCALLGEPHGEAIAVEVTLAMDLEFEENLLA
jgi:hypothetical protein